MIYMERCGLSRRKEAGDCFAMAECWSLAANAYADGKLFLECLSVCSKGRIFDEGLRLIEKWKKASYSSYSDEYQHKLNKTISSYLKDGALHYLELGDIGRMILFLKAFQSNDLPPFLALVRDLLNSRNLLDDLLRMEKELGNYIEAANIARTKGNVLLEAELLGKAKCFDEAIRLLLFHVLMRSLWPPGSNGWPLKSFSEKEDLLKKAKELAKCISGSVEEYVSLEADILSSRKKSLAEMSRQFSEAQKYQNFRHEIFAARAILDVHILSKPSKFLCQQDLAINSEKCVFESMSHNHLTAEAIMYFWNIWKARVFNLLSYLHHPEPIDENNLIYEEFYLEYFGVRKEDKEDCYVIHNLGAKIKLKNLARITASECISRAQRYWSNELSSVGMQVLNSLHALHTYFEGKRLYSLCRGKVAIWIYAVAKFLSESEFLPSGKVAFKVQGHLNTSTELFFNAAFPVDWRDSKENFKLFHENNIAMEMVEACIDRIVRHTKSKLTHDQIGRLVMLLLVRGRLNYDRFDKIVDCLNIEEWREFIMDYYDVSASARLKVYITNVWHIAFESTFSPDWKKDISYMSPHCFIYLMESLLFFASSCLAPRWKFFTTKSYLVEMLKSNGSEVYMRTSLSAVSRDGIRNAIEPIKTIAKNLLSNSKRMSRWMERSSMRGELRSILTQKLVIILCLSYLNSGRDIHEVGKFLSNCEICRYRPSTFSKTLQSAPGDEAAFLKVFAEALVMIENPLVIVCSPGYGSRLSDQNASTITSDDMQCREKLFLLLFPEMKETFEDKHCSAAGGAVEGLPPGQLADAGVGVGVDDHNHIKLDKIEISLEPQMDTQSQIEKITEEAFLSDGDGENNDETSEHDQDIAGYGELPTSSGSKKEGGTGEQKRASKQKEKKSKRKSKKHNKKR